MSCPVLSCLVLSCLVLKHVTKKDTKKLYSTCIRTFPYHTPIDIDIAIQTKPKTQKPKDQGKEVKNVPFLATPSFNRPDIFSYLLALYKCRYRMDRDRI
ncbi:hypothetical protein DL95DRAFT_383439, partial [Leptodontidium sp. 2 PMI_412]